MFSDVMGAYGSRFFVAAGGVGLALLVLVAILWFMRNKAPSPFVRGGRNRQPRLQVLDAAAVDTRRRLVLVRRDEVEHLIMIGGPTDIVIESGIGAARASSEAEPTVAGKPDPEPRAAAPQLRQPPPVEREANNSLRPVAVSEPAAALSENGAERPVRRQPPAAEVTVANDGEPVRQPAAERFVAAAPVAEQRPAPTQADQAADALEAARRRVMPNSQRVEPQVSIPTAPVLGRSNEAARSPSAEFKRVLEEEMTNGSAQDRQTQAINMSATRQPPPMIANSPRRDPDFPPITGADTELQNEVARIFGEITVKREK